MTVPANTASSAETYTFGLSAEGTKTVKATAATTVAGTTGPVPVVNVSGTLTSNTTWSPQIAIAYVVEATLDVPAGITLTLEPGTVIKSGGPSLMVEGTLDAVGSAASPIVFTSINDDSVGGATGTGKPAAGDWYGIDTSAGEHRPGVCGRGLRESGCPGRGHGWGNPANDSTELEERSTSMVRPIR